MSDGRMVSFAEVRMDFYGRSMASVKNGVVRMEFYGWSTASIKNGFVRMGKVKKCLCPDAPTIIPSIFLKENLLFKVFD